MAKYAPAGSGERVQEPDYSKTIILSRDDFREPGHLLQLVTIPPNTRQRLHLHKRQTEVYYILEGEAVITLAGEDFLARPGDAFICSPGDEHSLWNQSEQDFKLAVFKIDLPEAGDTVWLDEGVS